MTQDKRMLDRIGGSGRKVLISLLIIGLISLGVGAGTYAYFSDSEVSSGNSFSAGTLDLKLKDNSYWKDGIGARWTLSDMKPGGSQEAGGSVVFKREGSLSGDHLKITCDYSVIETPDLESDTDKDTSPANFADDMKITYCKYYNGNYVIDCLTGKDDSGTHSAYWDVADKDNDGEITLYDLKEDPFTNPPVPGDSLSSTTTFDLRVTLSSQAGDDVQGDTLNATMMFTLDQGPA